MTTMTNAAATTTNDKAPITLSSVIDALFMVNLREKLDAETAGDKSDAAYTWGL